MEDEDGHQTHPYPQCTISEAHLFPIYQRHPLVASLQIPVSYDLVHTIRVREQRLLRVGLPWRLVRARGLNGSADIAKVHRILVIQQWEQSQCKLGQVLELCQARSQVSPEVKRRVNIRQPLLRQLCKSSLYSNRQATNAEHCEAGPNTTRVRCCLLTTTNMPTLMQRMVLRGTHVHAPDVMLPAGAEDTVAQACGHTAPHNVSSSRPSTLVMHQ